MLILVRVNGKYYGNNMALHLFSKLFAFFFLLLKYGYYPLFDLFFILIQKLKSCQNIKFGSEYVNSHRRLSRLLAGPRQFGLTCRVVRLFLSTAAAIWHVVISVIKPLLEKFFLLQPSDRVLHQRWCNVYQLHTGTQMLLHVQFKILEEALLLNWDIVQLKLLDRPLIVNRFFRIRVILAYFLYVCFWQFRISQMFGKAKTRKATLVCLAI